MDDDTGNLINPEQGRSYLYPRDKSDLSDPEGWDNETYQDDLDYRDDAVDPISNEITDDPTEELGVPPEEFKAEMDKIALDDWGHDDEDSREALEDRDEADDSSAANA